MSSVNLPSTLSISEHGSYTQEIEDPDLVAKQLQEAAFKPVGSNKFEKRRQSIHEDDNSIVATVEIDKQLKKLEISTSDHVGITPLTPSSSLEIEPKIDWDQVFNVFLEVHRYERTFDYHGIPLENFLDDEKDLTDIYILVAANYLRRLQPIFRYGLVRNFKNRRIDAVDAHGRIDILRSIWNYKSGIPKQHFITNEPEYNIPVNSLIHLAGKYLLSIFQQNSPSDVHQGYYSIFSDIQDKIRYLEQRGISSDLANLEEYRRITVGVLPPQRSYYRDAIEISKTILSSATGRPLTGGEEQLTMDYLINMDSLFEEYTQIVLERQAEKLQNQSVEEDLSVEVKDKPSYSPFEDIRTNIEPDHVLCKNNNIVSILDTKYYSSGTDPTKNLENRKQMYRYSTILGVDEMTFVCPATEPQNRIIKPSGKKIKVISPRTFTTEDYEECIRTYLEEILDISTIETQIQQEIRTGYICVEDMNNSTFSELLSQDIFSVPLSPSFGKEIQKYVATKCDSVSNIAHIRRNLPSSSEFNNPVYNEIKDGLRNIPSWANIVLPVFFKQSINGRSEEELIIYYLEVKNGSIEKADKLPISIGDKWG